MHSSVWQFQVSTTKHLLWLPEAGQVEHIQQQGCTQHRPDANKVSTFKIQKWTNWMNFQSDDKQQDNTFIWRLSWVSNLSSNHVFHAERNREMAGDNVVWDLDASFVSGCVLCTFCVEVWTNTGPDLVGGLHASVYMWWAVCIFLHNCFHSDIQRLQEPATCSGAIAFLPALCDFAVCFQDTVKSKTE